MYLNTDPNKLYFYDLETDGLKPTKIHCVVFKHKAMGQLTQFINEDGTLKAPVGLKEFIEQLLFEGAIFCAYNGTSFDVPTLANLAGVSIPITSQLDPLVLSYLYNPAIEGGHSLEAYGERFKYSKQVHTDWSVYTPEMLNRCITDVHLLEKVTDALQSKMSKLGFSELSCEIEHYTREIVDRQSTYGFWFDRIRGENLYNYLRQREYDLAVPIQKLFPPTLEAVGTYTRRFRKDGSHTVSYQKHLVKFPKVEINKDDTYTCYDWNTFNIGSPSQRLKKLLSLGWKPTAYTKKGNPQVDEESLLKFAEESGRPEVKAMAEWLVCNGRANMVQTWLNYIGPDSRIHGRVFTCGATTRRMTHSSPNTANIPSGAKAAYGAECRSTWSVEPQKGLKLVGVDAGSLETVGLLHYLNNKKAEEALTRPKPNDVHTLNSILLTQLLGREVDREWGAKTCVPLDTQILTRSGWKTYDQVVIGEEVLGYNQETKLKEWTTLRGINVCEDEVIEFGNSFRTFRSTPSHKWFVKQRGTGKRPLKKHYFSDEIRCTDELTVESCVVINAPFNEEQDFRSINHWVKDQKYKINWTEKVLKMSHTERKQFLQGFLLADGHITEKDHWAWSQNVGEISEGLLVASYLVNDGQIHVADKVGLNEKMITVTLAKKSHVTASKFKKRSLGVQTVWCPATDLGSWVMRQGYNISITSNSWYAFLYGAYPPKLGSIVKGPPSDGEIVLKAFLKNVPGLAELIKEVQSEWKRNKGLLRTIDGGFVRCPSINAALNYKVQSLGAIVMKLAAIILDRDARDQGLIFHTVGTIHDEWQMEVKEELAEQLGKLAIRSIEKAAEQLKLRVPLTGSYKIGDTWQDTH